MFIQQTCSNSFNLRMRKFSTTQKKTYLQETTVRIIVKF